MNILTILVLALAALLAGWLVPRRWLVPVLLLGSLLALYWLQPSTPIRNLDFWLPTASIALMRGAPCARCCLLCWRS
jgi:hypothetical protein